MTTNELERLIAMLEPNAEEVTVDYVRRTLVGALECAPSVPSLDAEINTESQAGITDDWSCTSQGEVEHRTDQQAVDVFDSWLPNDPRNW